MPRYLIIAIGLTTFIGCQSAVKHKDNIPDDVLPTVQKQGKTTLIPNANSNRSVNDTKDLVGYWVGMFEPDLPADSLGSKNVEFGESGSWNRNNKINISIDSVDGNLVIGHSVIAGTEQLFKGNVKLENNRFELSMKEPGTDKHDGTFTMQIDKNDTLMYGTWQAFGKIEIPKRKYELVKKSFKYDANQVLDGYARFADWSKWVKSEYTDDEEGEILYDKAFFTTTSDVMNHNASIQILTEKEVSNLKKGDLYIIRNSIYARHGFSFKNRPLRAFFDRQGWYMPLTTNVKDALTSIEIKNIALLLRYEKNAREYYDVFGR